MKTKSLYILLTISIIIFTSIYMASENKKPIFRDAYAKTISPFQATMFDYSNIKDTTEKKEIFFNTIRPIIENQNQIIRDRRQHVLFAKQNNTDFKWLKDTAEKYKLELNESNPDWNQLLLHIDVIPVELVMVQAANESAWGTSRFAQKGNNLFGQWCFTKGCGIIPGQRNSGSNHEVKKFDSINNSVASYMHNINTTKAYKELRQIRESLREQGKPLNSVILATGLKRYSSRGDAYVKEIQSMIKTNSHLMQGI